MTMKQVMMALKGGELPVSIPERLERPKSLCRTKHQRALIFLNCWLERYVPRPKPRLRDIKAKI